MKLSYLRRKLRHSPNASEEKALYCVHQWVTQRVRQWGGIPQSVGSYARGTWLRHHRELDYYVRVSSVSGFLQLLARQGAELMYRTGGLHYARWSRVHQGRRYSVDLVPYQDRQPQRAILHRDYMLPLMTDQLRQRIRWQKYLVRRIGLYNADQHHQGLSGWAIQALTLRYGTLDAVPQTHHIPCPVDPTRNLLGSLSPENRRRFFRMRDLGWCRKSGREFVPNLYHARVSRIPRSPCIRRVVSLPDGLLIQCRECQRRVPRPPSSPEFYREHNGRVYLGTESLCKVYLPRVEPQWTPVTARDFTYLRSYHYFK